MAYDPKKHGPIRVVGPGFHDRVYAAVCQVPPGRITSYGDVAAELGARSVARHVGNALAGLRESDEGRQHEVPWHRVVNSRGRLSPRGEGPFSVEQRLMLIAEGVDVDEFGRVEKYKQLRFYFDE